MWCSGHYDIIYKPEDLIDFIELQNTLSQPQVFSASHLTTGFEGSLRIFANQPEPEIEEDPFYFLMPGADRVLPFSPNIINQGFAGEMIDTSLQYHDSAMLLPFPEPPAVPNLNQQEVQRRLDLDEPYGSRPGNDMKLETAAMRA